jgi:serine phosphatase RsbU (regulator of sigma subunit)
VTVEQGRAPLAAWKAIVVAVLVAAVFVFKLFVVEPGPLYLIPVLLAAVWFGPYVGTAVGVGCGALFGIGNELNPGDGMEESGVLVPGLIRAALYGAAGAIVGWLSRSRAELEVRVADAERELAEMHTIQEALAPPKPPVRPGIELATCYLPAEQGVAGDFYFVGPGSEGGTVIAIGDVAGRGLEAAKRAWFVRTVLASSSEFTPDPSQLLELANYSLMEDSGPSELFVTAACVVLRPGERTVRWAAAGHDAPVVLDDGSSPSGDGRGLPLGIEQSVGCTTSSFALDPGSGLLLFTDGLTEARTRNGDGRMRMFGTERVGALVSELAGEPPESIINRLRTEAEDFAGGSLDDDLCLVAARTSSEPDATKVC